MSGNAVFGVKYKKFPDSKWVMDKSTSYTMTGAEDKAQLKLDAGHFKVVIVTLREVKVLR